MEQSLLSLVGMCFHCFDCCLASEVKWWTHVSSIVTNLLRKLAGSSSKRLRFVSNNVCLVCFWSTVRSLGTQCGESFLISRSSVRMECTLSCEMPTVLAIYLSVTRLSVITISWTLLTISGVATATGLPGRGSSSRLCLPHLNSATHLFTVAYEGTSFPSVATISLWIS